MIPIFIFYCFSPRFGLSFAEFTRICFLLALPSIKTWRRTWKTLKLHTFQRRVKETRRQVFSFRDARHLILNGVVKQKKKREGEASLPLCFPEFFKNAQQMSEKRSSRGLITEFRKISETTKHQIGVASIAHGEWFH